MHTNTEIWAIGGGKGGVGKSLVSANLGITLATSGYRVVLVDLDLGGANLHTCLGCKVSEKTISDFLNREFQDIEELCINTEVPNLRMISGANDVIGIANMKHIQKLKLIAKLKDLQADYIIFDLGAGTTFNTLDFFLQAEKGIVVTLPEPTSIENCYRFVKSVYYRKLHTLETNPEIKRVVDEIMYRRNQLNVKSPADLIRQVTQLSPTHGAMLTKGLQDFRPKLIMNQIRNEGDVDIGFSIKTVCKKYFGIEVDYIGYLEYDHAVWQSIRKRRPLSLEFPTSPLVAHFQDMVRRLTAKDARIDLRL